MHDICTESIVPIVPKLHLKVLKYVWLVLIGLSIVLFAFVGWVALIPVIISWLLYRKTNQLTHGEYEYIHTNGIFDVDLVTNNSRRKSIVSVDLKQVVMVAPSDFLALSDYQYLPEQDFTGKQNAKASCTMVCPVAGKQQRLLLSLNQKMLDSLKKTIPGRVNFGMPAPHEEQCSQNESMRFASD